MCDPLRRLREWMLPLFWHFSFSTNLMVWSDLGWCEYRENVNVEDNAVSLDNEYLNKKKQNHRKILKRCNENDKSEGKARVDLGIRVWDACAQVYIHRNHFWLKWLNVWPTNILEEPATNRQWFVIIIRINPWPKPFIAVYHYDYDCHECFLLNV